MIGLLAKKLGMAHVYDAFGRRIAVTALQAGPCTVVGVREPKRDGYQAIQLAFEPMSEAKTTKPRQGQFKKAGVGCFRHVQEFRIGPSDTPPAAPETSKPVEGEEAAAAKPSGGWGVGLQLTLSVFQENELVDVTGTSIGKGFQGGIKRWGWSGGPATHGSMSHRRPGSIGSSTTPGRVFKGHHLPGHMGMRRVTVQNARIVRLDSEAHLLYLEGSVPGPDNGLIIIRKSVKYPGYIHAPQVVEVAVEEDAAAGKKAKAKAKAAATKK